MEVFHMILVLGLLALSSSNRIPKDAIYSKIDHLSDEIYRLEDYLNVEEENANDASDLELNDLSESNDASALPSESCGFETECADSFKQDDGAEKKWTKHISNDVMLDHTDPRGTSMLATFVSADTKKKYATMTYDFTIKATEQCGEFYYYMYNQEGCDVARFLVNLECNGEEQELFRKSASQNNHWQRFNFDIKKPVGTNCKLTFRASKGLSDTGKIYLDDVTMYFQRCPKEEEPNVAAHALCRFDKYSKCDWTSSGDVEWKYTYWGTPSSNTGPSRYFGVYSNNGHGKYSYLEASSPNNPFKSAILTSPSYSSPTQQCMRFFANMYGVDTGSLEASLLTDSGKKVVFEKKEDQGKGWLEGRIKLPVNQAFKVELKAVSGNGSKSDIAIDEIKVEEGSCDQKSLDKCDYTNTLKCQYKDDPCTNPKPAIGEKFEKAEQTTIERNKLIGTLPRVNDEWKLSIDILLKGKQRGWQNLIHLTNGVNCCSAGNRIPAIFVRSDSSTLYICYGINWSHNTCVDVVIPLNQWVTLQLEHLKAEGRFEYTIKLDGVLKTTKLNYKPQTFENIKVYAGDDWHKAANADVKNMKFENVGAIHKPCASKCEAFVEDADIDGKAGKALTYDMHFCEYKPFRNELVVAVNTVRAPRQGCFRLNYKLGKSRKTTTRCVIWFYHRRMHNNNQVYYKNLRKLDENLSDGWKTLTLDFDQFDEKHENRFGFNYQMTNDCSYVSFANFEILDGPCMD